MFRGHPSAARHTLGNSVLVVTTKASVGPGPGAAMTSVSSQTGPTTRLVLVERSTRSCRSTVPSFVPTGRVPSTRTGQRTPSGPPGIEGPSASTRPGRIDKKPASSPSSSPRSELGPARCGDQREPRAHRTRRPHRRVPRRPPQGLIEQCHLQCFRATGTTRLKRLRLVPTERSGNHQRLRVFVHFLPGPSAADTVRPRRPFTFLRLRQDRQPRTWAT